MAMAMATPNGVTDQITKLEAARKLVLGDATYYPQIVQGIIPIIGANARLELRRWGADFLAEAFASPSLAMMHKQSLSLAVLDTLEALLEIPGEDTAVLKGVVQASASIYPLVFRHVIANANDASTWAKMTAIKSSILGMWDTATMGVRICCIKFVQRVVLAQTPGVVADPRRPDQNEASLALVPRNHALIPPPNLEAEASGLLDRLLGVFQDQASDSLLIDATLNCLAVLIRSRSSVANKIIHAILNFDSHKKFTAPLTPKNRVILRSLERTIRALLVNTNKQNPNGPMASRIQQQIDRLSQSRTEIFDDSSRKRAAPSEPTDGLDQAKRAKLGAEAIERPNRHLEIPSQRPELPPLPSGIVSVAQLFTLTTDTALTSFDVQQFPVEMVVQLTLPIIYRLEQAALSEAVEGVRARVNSRAQQYPQPAAKDGAVSADVAMADDEDNDEDDYEPDYQPAEDVEQIANRLDITPSEQAPESDVSLPTFQLPPPPPLSSQEISQISEGTVARVISSINTLAEPTPTNQPKTGINRLAATHLDRAAWTTLITRLGTRASAAFEENDLEAIKTEGSSDGDRKTDMAAVPFDRGRQSLGSTVRDSLYFYVLEDFRKRIDAAMTWLTEEWYNDRMQRMQDEQSAMHYPQLALKVLDGLLPYIDSRDKIFTRFVSELPEIDEAILERVKSLARDPERVGLAVTTLHYLILFRPPVRDMCIDALEDLWRDYPEARPSAAKLLTKWRPEALEQHDPKPSTHSPAHDLGPAPVPAPAPAPAPVPAPAEALGNGLTDAPDDEGNRAVGADGVSTPAASSAPASTAVGAVSSGSGPQQILSMRTSNSQAPPPVATSVSTPSGLAPSQPSSVPPMSPETSVPTDASSLTRHPPPPSSSSPSSSSSSSSSPSGAVPLQDPPPPGSSHSGSEASVSIASSSMSSPSLSTTDVAATTSQPAAVAATVVEGGGGGGGGDGDLAMTT